MVMDISKFGKGARRLPGEKKAKHFRLVPKAYAPVNWSIPFRVKDSSQILNQNGSSSCTAHATVYYCQSLFEKRYGKPDKEEYSRRFIYSMVHLPGGGAYISEAMSIPVKAGLAAESSVPDGSSDEATEIDRSLNGTALIEAIAEKYAQLPHDASIDDLAAIVEQYDGFITGFDGQNDMFDARGVASVPSNPTWAHAVWVCGHTLLPDGRKVLIFKNSWSATWGDGGYGYLPEEFVKSQYLFDPYVYADVTDITMNINAGELRLLYNAVFGRDPDSAAQGYVGQDLSFVLNEFMKSPEYLADSSVLQAIRNKFNVKV